MLGTSSSSPPPTAGTAGGGGVPRDPTQRPRSLGAAPLAGGRGSCLGGSRPQGPRQRRRGMDGALARHVRYAPTERCRARAAPTSTEEVVGAADSSSNVRAHASPERAQPDAIPTTCHPRVRMRAASVEGQVTGPHTVTFLQHQWLSPGPKFPSSIFPSFLPTYPQLSQQYPSFSNNSQQSPKFLPSAFQQHFTNIGNVGKSRGIPNIYPRNGCCIQYVGKTWKFLTIPPLVPTLLGILSNKNPNLFQLFPTSGKWKMGNRSMRSSHCAQQGQRAISHGQTTPGGPRGRSADHRERCA